jgi:hypothetical protein
MIAQGSQESQSARSVLMIRPARFGANPATAETNAFQARTMEESLTAVRERVSREFDALAAALSDAAVEVCVVDDTTEPEKPDAIFPNNWVSLHADGTAVLYPLLAPNRRTERRLDVLEQLVSRHHFRVVRTVDLSGHETAGGYLEGTGSLVLDRVNRLAFASLSPRTQLDPIGDFAQRLDYEVISFEAFDAAGLPPYHTNVLMCVGAHFAVLCTGAILDEARRDAVTRILENTGHELIDITPRQMHAFAGNMLELENRTGDKIIVMSATAQQSLDSTQRSKLERYGRTVAVPIPTIEKYGGGSVRCMLAEIHLPQRS